MQESSKTIRSFSLDNLNRFKLLLSGTDWDDVLNNLNVEEAYDAFWAHYTVNFELCFPLRKIRFNRNIHSKNPFMSQGLMKSRDTKNRMHLNTLINTSEHTVTLYKNYCKLYYKTVRAAKKQHYTHKLQTNTSNVKKTWDTLNEILGRNKKGETIDKLNVNGHPETNPSKIADCFNLFFTNIGLEISNSIPETQKKPEDYINYGREIPCMQLRNTTPEHIKKIISKFENKKSCDVNGVSTKMIKFIGNIIAIPLSHIFNLSMQSGIFPSQLKKCRVIPIYKAGSPMECDNYRPISLLNAISKIFEKIIAEKLISHLLSNNLIYEHQYGFLPSRSSEHNLIQIVNYISNALNDNMYCIGVFLDLKKAFDVCSHSILLKKLSKMGIQGNALKWFASYLRDRSQCVDIGGTFSTFRDLAISVIQGSTLGPILFLCYINDFWSSTLLFSVLFADDTTGLARGKVLSDLTAYVNLELQKISLWYRANKMAVNTSKTKFIVFRTHGKQINPRDCEIVYNSNEFGGPVDQNLIWPIERVHNEGTEKSFKLLGVYFDEYLSFDAHISHLCAKVSKSLYCINKIKNFIDAHSLKKLYFAMIHSSILYCINVYASANKTTLNPLVLKQKQAIRIISNSGYRDHWSSICEPKYTTY